MLCDSCREREADIRITAIINGKEKTFHICRECAMKILSESNGLPDFGQIMQSLLSVVNYEEEYPDSDDNKEFSKTSDELLRGLVKSMFGQMQEAKERKMVSTKVAEQLEPIPLDEYTICKARLQFAIESEDYKAAAMLRDELACLDSEKEERGAL
ncbi:MAG: hypothetical protein GXZ11_08645 [Tissierellia bacterium]|nr:hypothetical protein [Tissierellia bacterium]